MLINLKTSVPNVNDNLRYYYNALLSRVLQIFEWQGLPETIDVDYLNIILLTEGVACITKHEDKLYCFTGNMGGEPNIYKQPTIFTVANPIAGSKTLTINSDCVLMFNTSLDKWGCTGGLHQLILNTAQILADNVASLNIIQKNARLTPIVTAETDAVKRAVDIILNNMYQGKPYTAVGTNLIDEIKVQHLVNSNAGNDSITKLIELQQYAIANFYHTIGINSNYNLKRERLISDELEINNDCLQVNINNMLEMRKKCAEALNKKYGLNVSVDFSEVIKNNDRRVRNPETDDAESTRD